MVSRSSIVKDCCAVTPLIGSILLVLLTFVFAGLVVVGVYGASMEKVDGSSTPVAMIEVTDALGGVPNEVRFKDNYVTLEHKGGDPLDLDTTFIILNGKGGGYVGQVAHGGFMVYGDVTAKYFDLTPSGTCYTYKSNNKDCIDDGLWSAGEVLVLNGDDSINGTDFSTVHVKVDGYSNTSNNYGFNYDNSISVKVFDTTTERFITDTTAYIRFAR